MQLNITGHNVEITPAMRDFVTAKFSKLEQFFDRINQVYIVLKVEKVTQIADANLHVNGGEIHASAEGQDMYAAIDGLIDKLARQLTKHQQQAFFEQGEEYMKPMVLADIAQAVEMHESTISRVTTQKYLHSPRGIFELKYFFSSHVNTEGGGEASSTAIRALVKKLIAAENPAKPLSDSKLTSMLSEQGIMVARRTVAKYRESLSIPPSNQRKQLV